MDEDQKTPLRVAIAEDSGLLRAGIARLITDAGHQIIAEAGDGQSFLKAIEQELPDVAVVDVRMPPGFKDEGLKAALKARRRAPGLPVLVLSQYVEERYGRELLESGAEGTGYPSQGPRRRRRRVRLRARDRRIRRYCAGSRGRGPAPGAR
jgi:DNA-binding NarL/FixJ family response regulator